MPSLPGPEVHSSLSPENGTLTRGLRLCVLCGIVSFSTFCLNVLPSADPKEDEKTREASGARNYCRTTCGVNDHTLPASSSSSSLSSGVRSSSYPASASPLYSFPHPSFVSCWWPKMKCILGCSGPEYAIEQLLEKFTRFAFWPGDEESTIRKVFLWRCEVVSAAAALVGVRCSQRALLDIVRPRELLSLWVRRLSPETLTVCPGRSPPPNTSLPVSDLVASGTSDEGGSAAGGFM